jgi:nucleoside-diphosphate-sugar epimerase
MNRILVTGATGFLGGAVISRLLDDPLQTNLLLLVRGDTAAGALFRVKQNLEQFAIPPNRINRLTEENILLGDLSEPNNFINDRRLDTLTQVLNCAAVASFGTNPLIWKVNVEGTFQLASRMARVPTLSRFVHVGTAMSCIPDPDSLIIEENRLRSEHRKHVVEYTRSKAEIETRMQTQLSELPLVIALPSIVVGHSTLGCIPSSSIFWVFRMALTMGKFMCSLDDRIDVIPVDYCADALCILLFGKNVDHGVYHISAGDEDSVSFAEIDKAMSQAQNTEPLGDNYQQVTYQELALMRKEFQSLFGPCNERIMLRAMNLYGYFSKLNVRFSNQKLRNLGLARPPRFSSYLHRCVETTQGMSIPQLMSVDFK